MAAILLKLQERGANPIACQAGAEYILEFVTQTPSEKLFVVPGGKG
jgi:hypothetical protein